ncbi:MAG: hypothetical protein MUO82_11825 [Candidatus Thermoplasmatota archaeon]|nr:hypothetical protein [Candidatus Thermoplasmatota archaeon]
MPGAIPHIIAGFALFIIGRYYFKDYFNENDKSIKLFLLAFACISFSIIPDFPLIIYYLTYAWSSICDIYPYHDLLHIILFIIAFFGLFVIKFFSHIKIKPIWIMGMWAILLHITMDLVIPEIGIWI